MNKVLLVLTNLPDNESAQALAHKLIETQLAACVNILPGCNSVYHWKGQIESMQEIPLLIKTTRAAYPRLEELIRKLHPYELPEIIAVPVVAGLPAYLQWVVHQTSSTNIASKE